MPVTSTSRPFLAPALRRLASMCLLIALGLGVLAAVAEGTAQERRRPEVAVIYFPSWHEDDHYSAWLGEGWNEWDLVESARPRFEGHQLLKPAQDWGHFDEADPEMMARQIDLASEFGVDVFIFDWYWYNGVKILHGALERGFLAAPNREEMKFATMWANHTWGNYFPYPYEDPFHIWLPMRHSSADFERVIQYHIDHYFNQPNYWRLDGGLYFSIFAPEEFVKQLGGPQKTKSVLEAARRQVADAGLGEIHFAGFTGIPESVPSLREAGFDSLTSYNVTTASLGLGQPDHPTVPYQRLIEGSEQFWDNMDTGELPYAPVVTVGWDVTYRWENDVPWPPRNGHYPYTPVVVDNTPEKFGDLVRRALRHSAGSPESPPFILINALNEWTEGSALLPSTLHGNGYLEALKAALEAPVDEPMEGVSAGPQAPAARGA